MAEREQPKRGPQVGSGELVPSRKKPRAYAIPQAVVKQEPPEEGPRGEEAQQVGEAGRGAGAGAVVAMEEQIDFRMGLSLFRCRACLLPLKPPTFKCADGHIVCATCRASHALACGGGATYAACPDADAFVRDAKVPCAFAEHGCASYVAYYQAADHERACPWAPCHCPDPGCDAFTSPARLLEHFRAEHPSWPITSVAYGRATKLALPAPQAQGLHLLVGKDNDRRVFLVSASALGPAMAVSVACVRAKGDAAAGVPQFDCKLWVEYPRDSGNVALLAFPVPSSDLSAGFSAAERGRFLAVPPDMMAKEDAPGGEAPDLMIRIEKAGRAAARSSSGRQLPATA
ncbi:unnamed protein product [Urochloa decumbens]|uniref:SIAH-type domain-containing protein n=1 Tax=Urochloa decumbens TaxID=240449 RepID=A0ABC9AGF5_9POAL